MQTPKLFSLLPKEYIVTPDGMAINKDGDHILACPNFADLSYPGCLVKNQLYRSIIDCIVRTCEDNNISIEVRFKVYDGS